MYECFNCGMLPDACVCIPWCYKHDRRDIEPRCQPCVVERREEAEKREQLKSITLPWYVVLYRYLTGE
jgi:hypothetical protein